MKRLAIVLVVLAALVVLVVGAGFFFLDGLVRRAVERGGTYALGVETEVGGVDLDLGSEAGVRLEDVTVDNPEGFAEEHFLRIAVADASVLRDTLTGDVVVMPLIEVVGVAIQLERAAGRTNYGVILENLERFESGEKPPPDEEPGKVVRLERLELRDVQATVDMIPQAGEAARFTLALDRITVEEFESDMTPAEIVSLVVRTLVTALIENGAGVLPPELLEDLRGRLGDLETVALQVAGDAVQQAQGAVQEAIQGAEEDLRGRVGEVEEDLRRELGEEAGDVLKGLGDRLKKKPPQDG